MIEFILGYSVCGLILNLLCDTSRNDKLFVVLGGPFVWIAILLDVVSIFLADKYLKRKYHYVLYQNKETKRVRMVDVYNNDDVKLRENEKRMRNLDLFSYGYALGKNMYNKFDYWIAENFLNIYLQTEAIMDKDLAEWAEEALNEEVSE